MTRVQNFVIPFVFLGLCFSGCAASIYSPIASKDNDTVKKEQAIDALDKSDYGTAETLLADLWTRDKSDQMTQLYAVSMLGGVGLDIFSVISGALTKASSGSSSGSGDDLMSQISAVLPDGIDQTKAKEKLKSAIDVLNQATNKSAVTPLLCFSGGIYVSYAMTDFQTQLTDLQTSLKSDLESLPTACSSGASGVDSVGAKVQASVQKLGDLANTLVDVTNTVGTCLETVSGGATNDVQKTLTSFTANADLGCDLPDSGLVGNLPLPACMKDFVTAGATAKAGDGKIDGCELFIHCASGSCLGTSN